MGLARRPYCRSGISPCGSNRRMQPQRASPKCPYAQKKGTHDLSRHYHNICWTWPRLSTRASPGTVCVLFRQRCVIHGKSRVHRSPLYVPALREVRARRCVSIMNVVVPTKNTLRAPGRPLRRAVDPNHPSIEVRVFVQHGDQVQRYAEAPKRPDQCCWHQLVEGLPPIQQAHNMSSVTTPLHAVLPAREDVRGVRRPSSWSQPVVHAPNARLHVRCEQIAQGHDQQLLATIKHEELGRLFLCLVGSLVRPIWRQCASWLPPRPPLPLASLFVLLHPRWFAMSHVGCVRS